MSQMTRTDSRSMFHFLPASSAYSSTDNATPESTQQFGVSLRSLEEREKEKVPMVVRKCVEYLEKEGLEVTGIFHRAPNNVKVRAIKRQFDLGE